MPKPEKQIVKEHESRIADAVATAQAAVKTAAAAYNGLASGYTSFAASVASAEATRDAAIAASIVSKQQDESAARQEAWRQLPAVIRVK